MVSCYNPLYADGCGIVSTPACPEVSASGGRRIAAGSPQDSHCSSPVRHLATHLLKIFVAEVCPTANVAWCETVMKKVKGNQPPVPIANGSRERELASVHELE